MTGTGFYNNILLFIVSIVGYLLLKCHNCDSGYISNAQRNWLMTDTSQLYRMDERDMVWQRTVTL